MPMRVPGIRICKAMSAAVLVLFLILFAHTVTAAEKGPVFDVITISAAITPPIAEYIVQSIGEAAKNSAEGLIIRLDTPGGLDLAMRDIAKGILNAPIPVIVYVAPSGAT
jgi:membrane-bound serine protease (ClpP class)